MAESIDEIKSALPESAWTPGMITDDPNLHGETLRGSGLGHPDTATAPKVRAATPELSGGDTLPEVVHAKTLAGPDAPKMPSGTQATTIPLQPEGLGKAAEDLRKTRNHRKPSSTSGPSVSAPAPVSSSRQSLVSRWLPWAVAALSASIAVALAVMLARSDESSNGVAKSEVPAGLRGSDDTIGGFGRVGTNLDMVGKDLDELDDPSFPFIDRDPKPKLSIFSRRPGTGKKYLDVFNDYDKLSSTAEALLGPSAISEVWAAITANGVASLKDGNTVEIGFVAEGSPEERTLCGLWISIATEETVAREMSADDCSVPAASRPRCSAKIIWRKAARMTDPRPIVIDLVYSAKGWTVGSKLIEDDCRRRQDGDSKRAKPKRKPELIPF